MAKVQSSQRSNSLSAKQKVQTLKGFRDIAPEEALKRGRALALIKSVLKSYGFVPLETATLEYAELVEKEVGEEMQKLIFKFQDRGGRWVALRAEHTPSLARFVAQNYGELTFPFKRYQIGSIFRAEKPQKGRFREFTQLDYDTVGVDSALADAEIVAVTASILEILGVKGFTIKINDRTLFEGLPKKAIIIIDKIEKIGKEKVTRELKAAGANPGVLKELTTKSPTPRLELIFKYLANFGISERKFAFDPTLARGLEYYTGPIFEVTVEGKRGSIAGGGRFDNLIGTLLGKKIPAVGISFGLDRLMEVVPQKTWADIPFCPKVLVTVFAAELAEEAIRALTTIQGQGIDVEIYPDPGVKLDKQLKYANKKGIPYVIIIGPEEAKNKEVTIKDLRRRRQKTVPIAALTTVLRQE